MAKKIINIGKSQNKGDGDPLRTAFSKVNDNFDELYSGTFTDTTDFTTSIIPRTDNVISLGSSTKRWSELYVKDFIFINGVRLSGSASGDLVVGGNIVQAKDIVGSIFADDSKLMMDGLTGTLYGPMIGDVTGSVFADNSTMLVDGVNGRIVGPVFANVTGDTNGTHTGAVVGNVTGNLTGNVDGDITGSIFGDDSSLIVDGNNNKVILTNNTTAELIEGPGNLYYTDARFDTRLSAKNTDQLTEGASNKYYSSTLANADIDARITSTFINNLTGVVADSVDGDITGSVFGDDSTLLVDAVANIIPSSVVSGTEATNWNTAYSWGDHSVAGYLTSVPAQTFASLTGKPTTVAGYGITDAHTGAFDGEVTGSVFGDDSTLLVDGNNNKIVGAVDTTSLRTSEFSIALGHEAGQTNQGNTTVAVGFQAGKEDQGTAAVAIGDSAGESGQGTSSVAVGISSGKTNQGMYSTAVGYQAGKTTQGQYAVAIGNEAGETTQGANTVAIGKEAGQTSQGQHGVAVGEQAGETNQGVYTVAIGMQAGQTSQGGSGVAIGYNAGGTSQGTDGIAIGQNAGASGQGTLSIAIGEGAGKTNQAANSIVINATGTEVNNTTASSLVITPILNLAGTTHLQYDATSGQVTHSDTINAKIVATTATPPTGNADAGDTGEIRYDDNYLYIKTASGWKRTALSGIV